ncbi:MAG: PTS sugar transporter subunit IIA [Clostridiaceae bacterium]|jgi:PTS system mannose-specific IIA component|nr:PTS sugar transporter subunit IIA [Clostridiaceae bacterium]
MVGILIVSHAPLASAFIESAKMIIGEELPPCDSLNLIVGQDMDAFAHMLEDKLNRLDFGEGVLVIADLFAGSPANAVAYRLNRSNVELVTGANLGMVIEALSSSSETELVELKNMVLEAGLTSIVDVGKRMQT